jgi:predicted nuclease of predicted toxin-antitoxin system
MAKLYLDECVPLSLMPLLAQYGQDVTTAMQLGLRQRNDPFHFKYASTRERVHITTNQSDFRLLHSGR